MDVLLSLLKNKNKTKTQIKSVKFAKHADLLVQCKGFNNNKINGLCCDLIICLVHIFTILLQNVDIKSINHQNNLFCWRALQFIVNCCNDNTLLIIEYMGGVSSN